MKAHLQAALLRWYIYVTIRKNKLKIYDNVHNQIKIIEEEPSES